MKKLTLAALVLTVAALSGCSEKPATAADEKAVESVLDNLSQALETQDLTIFSDVISHDPNMVFFGFGPDERWVGYKALENAIRDKMDRYDNLHLIPHDREVTIGPSGDVAWFSELLDWNMMIDGGAVNMKNARFSGVLEKDNGVWKIVQFHLSSPQG